MNKISANALALSKLLLFIFIIVLYFLSATLFYLIGFNPQSRRRRLIKNTQFFCRLLIWAYDVKLVCKNLIPEDEVSLVVGNHMGFIDILCMQSLQPCVFVTSTEMKNTPVLGQIAILGGSCFVNRSNRENIQIELKELIDVLKAGFRVGLFPEARASNGEQVLPFKKTLLTAAAYARVPIRPYVFNYIKVNDRDLQFSDRDSLCWYDDNSFVSAIWKSLQIKSILCEIEFLPLIHPTPEDDRTFISEKTRNVIAEKFRPFHPEM
jgi:lyso-ornithine lipid O-acyltransferase